MKKFLGLAVLLAASLVALSPSRAGVVFLREKASGCASYVGPGDLVLHSPVQRYWGLRAVSCAYAQGLGKAITIRRASDNTTLDVHVTSAGDLDTTTAGTFCAATTCFLSDIYEQITNASTCTLSQATTSAQPQLIFNFSGATPAISFVSANSQALFHLANTCLGSVQPFQSFTVAQATSTTGSNKNIFTNGGLSPASDVEEGFISGTVNAFMLSKSAGPYATKATTLSVAHSFQYIYNDAVASSFIIDGSATTVTIGDGFYLLGSDTTLGRRSASLGDYFDGYIMEHGISSSGSCGGCTVWTLSDAAAMRANQKTYWGTP